MWRESAGHKHKPLVNMWTCEPHAPRLSQPAQIWTQDQEKYGTNKYKRNHPNAAKYIKRSWCEMFFLLMGLNIVIFFHKTGKKKQFNSSSMWLFNAMFPRGGHYYLWINI